MGINKITGNILNVVMLLVFSLLVYLCTVTTGFLLYLLIVAVIIYAFICGAALIFAVLERLFGADGTEIMDKLIDIEVQLEQMDQDNSENFEIITETVTEIHDGIFTDMNKSSAENFAIYHKMILSYLEINGLTTAQLAVLRENVLGIISIQQEKIDALDRDYMDSADIMGDILLQIDRKIDENQ